MSKLISLKLDKWLMKKWWLMCIVYAQQDMLNMLYSCLHAQITEDSIYCYWNREAKVLLCGMITVEHSSNWELTNVILSYIDQQSLRQTVANFSRPNDYGLVSSLCSEPYVTTEINDAYWDIQRNVLVFSRWSFLLNEYYSLEPRYATYLI